MLLSALRPSQRAVVEKQLRKNIGALFLEGASPEVLGSEGFVQSRLEVLLEDTDCEVAPGEEGRLRSWWASEVQRKGAVKEWNLAVQAFAEAEAARLGVDSYSAKAVYLPCPKALMEALLLTEDDLGPSDVASDDDSAEDSEEDSEEESEEEESDEAEEELAEEASQLGIKKRKLAP